MLWLFVGFGVLVIGTFALAALDMFAQRDHARDALSWGKPRD
ncbi:MAG TPA: hypothetical protein VHU21_23270 [Paraburkholderia sp.]|nr:hypothetical protein [Paraburkholderia sp.]